MTSPVCNPLGGGMNLARAELTGPSLSRLSPNLQSTARRLWLIYSVLTAFELGLLYYVGDMSLFDSVNYSMTTLASGSIVSLCGLISLGGPRILTNSE